MTISILYNKTKAKSNIFVNIIMKYELMTKKIAPYANTAHGAKFVII